eukprot:TRINITY_DN8316_c0_g1_i2.p1 TRINITY_DN8316_c0_g1~~TRINITY_DN8316_c0_g1_i2.p1  ORF type:complete len:403 (+),score=145.67 TRINITY_DN8316_c0_g1_i2:353-1561(+)
MREMHAAERKLTSVCARLGCGSPRIWCQPQLPKTPTPPPPARRPRPRPKPARPVQPAAAEGGEQEAAATSGRRRPRLRAQRENKHQRPPPGSALLQSRARVQGSARMISAATKWQRQRTVRRSPQSAASADAALVSPVAASPGRSVRVQEPSEDSDRPPPDPAALACKTQATASSSSVEAWLAKRKRRNNPEGYEWWMGPPPGSGQARKGKRASKKRSTVNTAEPPPPPVITGPLSREQLPCLSQVEGTAQGDEAVLWVAPQRMKRIEEARRCADRLVEVQERHAAGIIQEEFDAMEQAAAEAGQTLSANTVRRHKEMLAHPLPPDVVAKQRRAVFRALQWAPDPEAPSSRTERVVSPRGLDFRLFRAFRRQNRLSPTLQLDAWADIPGAINFEGRGSFGPF